MEVHILAADFSQFSKTCLHNSVENLSHDRTTNLTFKEQNVTPTPPKKVFPLVLMEAASEVLRESERLSVDRAPLSPG